MKHFLLVISLSVMVVAPLASFAQSNAPGFATQQTSTPVPPVTTFNLGVQVIDQRIYRIFHELTKNVSARVTSLDTQDKVRIDQMYTELLSAIDTVGIAGTDTCKTDFHYLYEIPLNDFEMVNVTVENEAINSAVRYLFGADIGLRQSASTRRNDCLEATDYEDLVEAVLKSKSWLDNFYTNTTPMDMPQSHPRESIVDPTALAVPAAN